MAYRFTVDIEMPGPVTTRRKSVVIDTHSLEAAQAELYAGLTWWPQGIPSDTKWTMIDVQEVYPPNYE